MSTCYVCNECAKFFTTLQELDAHIKEHYMEDGETEESSASSSNLSPHDENMEALDCSVNSVSNNDESDKFTCRFCPRTFEELSQMNIHYKHTHHDKPHYECEKCNQVFAVKRELSTHQRTHSGEQPHKCKICKKEFGTRQLLKKHTMWHSGQRSHVCKYCAKAFYQFSYRLIDTFQNIPLVPFATNYL
ncbi:unnamed protein product [Dracunculus medinensis]|uniref:Zinc finger protein n=1 Tax=Dracunculus medinensis TaxID=318479 RepID=A0A0N4UKR4_DRAME|nr:unnamed protein product [Dracunculus medinensis]